MSPDEIQQQSEHSIQAAIFCWANKAERFGFRVALDMRCYSDPSVTDTYKWCPVPELHWLHAIPNGGKRDAVIAGKLKAEGVKPGIFDIFLPVSRHYAHGLYIECKRPKERLSIAQKQFANYLADMGYMSLVCTDWIDCADFVEWYLTK